MNFIDILINLWESTGIYASTNWQNYVMIAVSLVLFYLAIARKFEPLLLLPIAFGMLIVNIPGGYEILYADGSDGTAGGLLYYLYFGVDKVIFPPLIFLGIGAMTDFGPLIANPKSLLLGAAAQLGIFVTFFGAVALGFRGAAAAAIAIIGGADGPTAIWLTQQLGQSDLLPIIAIAAYSYMALIPIIQPPIMKLLTTKKERSIRMKQLREVSKREKIIFPIVVTLLVGLILPSALPLVGCLMLGNLLKESTVTDRLAKTASNELINIVTILLGIVVGSKAVGTTFLQPTTLLIIGLGLFAFVIGTMGGVLMAKLMNVIWKGQINPLIGSAGVSAVPMAARVSSKEGQKEVPDNYLLMHAMGPNVAGVIGSAVAAGLLLAVFGG
ncbi:MAG: sodium ion-translocating decarboxylase subunit beta [Clostridia bacterium]|nr:sodium ion-translocating decarboxylase subunit beta [Clostridia bacterium]